MTSVLSTYICTHLPTPSAFLFTFTSPSHLQPASNCRRSAATVINRTLAKLAKLSTLCIM
ncbi:unnamed protein product [Periconia digitata]|uniref:Uncharacterized protein n=1 Tax=Periconia digitata TaxID=1303443 RepID=A0A9W4XRL4_9PLEO|nr:unnamed protein product [Periconia digitata]